MQLDEGEGEGWRRGRGKGRGRCVLNLMNKTHYFKLNEMVHFAGLACAVLDIGLQKEIFMHNISCIEYAHVVTMSRVKVHQVF